MICSFIYLDWTHMTFCSRLLHAEFHTFTPQSSSTVVMTVAPDQWKNCWANTPHSDTSQMLLSLWADCFYSDISLLVNYSSKSKTTSSSSSFFCLQCLTF